ncbi:MAG: DUF192 domain-containing protein [Chloroflexi bacterium]|nr:DUF192 domain-containing protein [Chloroflexota bacterium]
MEDVRRLRAFNRTRQVALVERGNIADNPLTRLRGLLGRRTLAPGDGLLLCRDNAIHTMGMQFAIDVLFLDRAGTVVYLIAEMPPLRFSPFVWRARDVLELPAGTLARTDTTVGDAIEIQIV